MERRGYDADVSSCSKIVRGLCQSNLFEKAQILLNIMVERGGSPEIVGLATLIKMGGSSNLGEKDTGDH